MWTLISWYQDHVFSLPTYHVHVHIQFDVKEVAADVKSNREIILLN